MIKKTIVTTTIYPPSKALFKYVRKKDWNIIIVGDKKTPDKIYRKFEKSHKNVIYLSPEDQERKYKKVSKALCWNCIMRRNIGFLEAYQLGARVIATVDDDNIPYKDWGKEVFINKEIEINVYEPKNEVFDPLSITNNNFLWHRGYPIDLLPSRLKVYNKGKAKRRVLIQAGLWDGDPDIDALARLAFNNPNVKFNKLQPYGSNKISPFNSQNTFISREVLPYYAVLPYIGRMDDIWGSYILQNYFPDSVVYTKATVHQERNIQSAVNNLENEIFGYRNTLNFIRNIKSYETFLPAETREFYNLYRAEYNKFK